MNKLDDLKKELREDFGKVTCWKWLCKERNATSEQERIVVAEEVLAMPRMGNVAAAQSYWLRLHGKRTGDIREILDGRSGASRSQNTLGGTNDIGFSVITTSDVSQHGYELHRINADFNLEQVERQCKILISQRGAKMLGDEILEQLHSGYLSDKTYKRLSRWCHPERSESKTQPIAQELSRQLFGQVISRIAEIK